MMKSDLNTGIRYLKGVGEKRAEAFARLGIFTVSAGVYFAFRIL